MLFVKNQNRFYLDKDIIENGDMNLIINRFLKIFCD